MKAGFDVKQCLVELGVTPEKRFGQNFLTNPSVIDLVCRHVGDITSETVVEIGPGLGAISEFLSNNAKSYFAIELERKFCSFLAKRFPKLEAEGRIIQSDAREVALTPEKFGQERLTVISNLPYSISSEMCLWMFENATRIKRSALLLQREFAERIAAQPGERRCGSLSVLRSLYADAKLGPIVGGGSFYPRADVDSRLLSLSFLPQMRHNVSRPQFEKVVRAAFSTRRKTLLNALSHGEFFGNKTEVEKLLVEAGVDPQRRAETLSLAEFVAITNLTQP